MFADPAGELLDWPVIAVRDHRSNIHRDIPFHFDVKGELLPGSYSPLPDAMHACAIPQAFALASAEIPPGSRTYSRPYH